METKYRGASFNCDGEPTCMNACGVDETSYRFREDPRHGTIRGVQFQPDLTGILDEEAYLRQLIRYEYKLKLRGLK